MKKLISLIILLQSSVSMGQETQRFIGQSALDFTQETVSRSLFQITNGVDSLFGKNINLEENNGSHIRMDYTLRNREYSEPTTEPDIDIRVRLRNLERKLNFKFTSDRIEEDETLPNQRVEEGADQGQTLQDTIYRASLGFLREQKKYWSISVDTGVRVQDPPTPFVRARGRRSFYFFKDIELRLVDRIQLIDREGIFNYTDINFNYRFSSAYSLTFANKYFWKDAVSELTSSHGPSLVYIIDDNQTLSYNLRTRFTNIPDSYAIYGHEVFLGYRRNMYKRWIFVNITPGLSYRAENEYTQEAFVNVTLQALFGTT